jgi:adenylate cyclase
LPDKPSIAVLPFDNFGRDLNAEHLADGLTEDLITALAKVRELFVIARHSTAIYKGKAVKVQEIAETLGVKYVLEGSVQETAGKLRITPQLIDATSGHHIWAERYDRPMDDIFVLQDEIVRRVLIELQVKLTEGDGARIASRGTNNLEAWLLWVQGRGEARRFTREGNVRALELFEAAHRADPNWARPLGSMAKSHYFEARDGWSVSRQESIARGIECAERAIAMDPEEIFGYEALRGLNLLRGNYSKALSLAEKAATLAPNDVSAVGTLAAQLTFMGEAERAVEVFERAVRLGPIVQKPYQRIFGIALHLAGRTDHAITVLEALARQEPEWAEGLAQLAAAYADAGRIDAAQATTNKILERDPRYTASRYLALVLFQDAKHTEWLRALLLKAGLPD